jgi:Predicted transcriptional regulators
MKVTLTLQEKLKDLRLARQLTLEELAEQTGLSKSALGTYEIDDFKDISHHSITTLAKFYGVSGDYLLGLTENEKHSNVALSQLHLSDDMVELLKSGKINTRLLCEIATHPDFSKLLADIEIYVDGIAAMQIKNLNGWVKHVRNEIIAKHNPGDDDPHLRTLSAAQIDEDEYFRHMIHGDINGIIGDIKEAHKGDNESAPDTSVLDEMKKGMEAAVNFEGSPQEKQLVGLCHQLGIDYKSLTSDEFQMMIKVFRKSSLLRSPFKMRGKTRGRR